jgi:two-component system response regulator AtoC
MNSVLLIDDDEGQRKQLYWTLKDSYELFQAADRLETLQIVSENPVDLALLDLHLPPKENTPEEGMKLLREIRRAHSEIVVVVITADGEKKTSLEAVKHGAYDYFTKPLDVEEVKIVLKRALYMQRLQQENERLQRELEDRYTFSKIVGKSKKMQETFRLIKKVAMSNCLVLLQGESGTGKELVGRAIHYNSLRKEGPFVPVNCAALPESLLESELFGHEKGAFTGAGGRKLGKFEVASGGTIFLDEIADMSLAMQAKILRVVQEQSFERVGGTKPIKVDLRVISATNKDLEKAMAKGLFREDLYHRLNVITIYLSPLHKRKEDIPLLANYFLKRYNRVNGRKIKTISAKALDLLMDYNWPGNVRELENVIERAVVLTNNEVILPEDILLRSCKRISDSEIISSLQPIPLLEGEKVLIHRTFRTTHWNQTKAAQLLGIHRNTLRRKIKYFKIREK